MVSVNLTVADDVLSAGGDSSQPIIIDPQSPPYNVKYNDATQQSSIMRVNDVL